LLALVVLGAVGVGVGVGLSSAGGADDGAGRSGASESETTTAAPGTTTAGLSTDTPTVAPTPAPTVFVPTRLGTFHTQEEVEIWRTRAKDGPYATKSDAFPNSPAEYERIQSFADVFAADPEAERWVPGSPAHTMNERMLAAAFVSLLDENATLGATVGTEILWHVQNITLDHYISYFDGAQSGFAEASWLERMFLAYEYVETVGGLTEEEHTAIRKWFAELAEFTRFDVHRSLVNLYPDRLARNYTTAAGVCQKPLERGYYTNNTYTTYTADGDPLNPMLWCHINWHNRLHSKVRAFGIIGVGLGNESLVYEAVTFMQEWLRFAVYPDGETSEASRNGDYGRSGAGTLTYGVVCIESYIAMAEALARTGDMSLYEYETSEGIGSTIAPADKPKSFRMTIDYVNDLLQGRLIRWSALPVTNASLQITHYDNNVYYVTDVVFAMANGFYRDAGITADYTRQGSIPYPASDILSAGPRYWAGGGPSASFPSLYFQYGQMEDANVRYPPRVT
jgi:hypothetical protein